MARPSAASWLGGHRVEDAVEDTRLELAQAKAVGQRVRGEDLARDLLGLFGHVRQHAAVPGLRAVRLAALRTIPLQAVDHLVEANLLWSPGQFVTAVRPARGGDEAGAPEDHQHLVEKRSRDFLPAGDLATLKRTPAGMAGQLQDGPDAVLGFHRKAHTHDT